MSIYNSPIYKPTTQIFSLQPKHEYSITIDDDRLSDSFSVLNKHIPSRCYRDTSSNTSNHNKPVAFVSPIEVSKVKDQSIQTDSVSIDMNTLIDINDYHRSERIIGRLNGGSDRLSDETEEIRQARERIRSLEDSLSQQMANNEDIKKLLIAALGEDLAAQALKLTSDAAGASRMVEQLLSERSASSENINELMISADLWKNKFFAGRILLDELAGWKHQFSIRYKESLDSIHVLLQERQSLRQLLTFIRDELLIVSSHLSFKPVFTALNNTLDLAKFNLTTIKTIKNKLSDGVAWKHQASANEEEAFSFKSFTEGEEFALEVLKNQPNPYADNTARITTSFSSENSKCLEKIADKICKNCKGDIFVV